MTNFEILRSEVDANGHDLVIECNGCVRHIQLKSTYRGSTVDQVTASLDLARRPCGCVVWLEFDSDMKLGPYLWFGAGPGHPLPPLGDKVAHHTRGRRTEQGTVSRSPRPNHRVLRKNKLSKFDRIEDLVQAMFGPIA